MHIQEANLSTERARVRLFYIEDMKHELPILGTPETRRRRKANQLSVGAIRPKAGHYARAVAGANLDTSLAHPGGVRARNEATT